MVDSQGAGFTYAHLSLKKLRPYIATYKTYLIGKKNRGHDKNRSYTRTNLPKIFLGRGLFA
jgi:hypothetical protein